MADTNKIVFLKGKVAGLPSTATPGAVYFTEDEGLYLGLADGSLHRYGDFITVANIEALPAAGAHEKAMYYCESENILAKWNGSSWVQINKQKTLAELGGVAKSVYEAKMTALEKADSDNTSLINGLSTYIGTIPAGSEATNVIAYIDAKTTGIASDEALESLSERVDTAEDEIDTLQAAIAEGGSVANAIAAAQEQADKGVADAAAALAKANEKTTMAEVEGKNYATKSEAQGYADAKDAAIAAAQKAGDDAAAAAKAADNKAVAAQGAADAVAGHVTAIKAEIGEMPEKAPEGTTIWDTIMGIAADSEGTYADLRGYIEDIQEDYLKAADKTELEGKITEVSTAVATEKSRAEGIEAGLETRLAAVEADYLKAVDKTELQNNINTLTGVVETLRDGIDAEKVDGVKDFIKYVEEHGSEVTGIKEDIEANAEAIEGVAGRMTTAEGKITAVEGAVATKAEKTYVDEAIQNLVDIDNDLLARIDNIHTKLPSDGHTVAEDIATALQEAKDYTDDEIAELNISDYVKKADADAAYAPIGHDHDEDYDAKGAAAQALVDAKSYADQAEADAIAAAAIDAANKDAVVLSEAQKNIAAVETALGADIALKANAADVYTKTEVDTKVNAKANSADVYTKTEVNSALALKANTADVYAKTQTFTKEEVNSAIADAVAAAQVWGSF